MNKITVLLFGTTIQMCITFIILSCIINISFIQKIKKISEIKNIIFGLHLTLIGILTFYLTYTYMFTSMFWSIAMYFLPIYIITTGFMMSLVGYFTNLNHGD